MWPHSDNEGAQHFPIGNVPPGYVYSHATDSNDQFFNLDVSAKHSKHDRDFNSGLLTDEQTSTG